MRQYLVTHFPQSHKFLHAARYTSRMDPAILSYVPALLWALFAGATFLSISLGALLAYHWYRYAMHTSGAFTATVVYAVITGFFLISLFAATIALIQSL